MVFLSNYGHWSMTVTGPTYDLNRFVAAINGETEFDFDQIIPVPAADREVRHILGGEKYDYAAAWGASQPFDLHILYDLPPDDDKLQAQWSCVGECWPIIEQLVRQFPMLVFTGSYADDGDRSYVTFESHDGQLHCEEGDYDKAFGEDEDEEGLTKYNRLNHCIGMATSLIEQLGKTPDPKPTLAELITMAENGQYYRDGRIVSKEQ